MIRNLITYVFYANMNILCGEIGVTIISPHDKQIVHLSAEIGVLWLSVYIGKPMRLSTGGLA